MSFGAFLLRIARLMELESVSSALVSHLLTSLSHVVSAPFPALDGAREDGFHDLRHHRQVSYTCYWLVSLKHTTPLFFSTPLTTCSALPLHCKAKT